MKTMRIRVEWILLLLSSLGCGQTLPAGTTFEARLSTATGSRLSHRGDQVEATIISPVSWQGTIIVPQGSQVRGTVASVVPLGLGLKNRTARIEYRFYQLQLAPGETIAIEAQLVKVDTARERVDSHGVVLGVHPLAYLSSASNFYTLPLLFLDPAVGVPVWGIKALLAPSTSPEIYFPPGAEFILRLNRPVNISGLPHEPVRVESFSTDAVADVREQWKGSFRSYAQAGDYASDSVNLLVMGTRRQIDKAFQAAGWSAAERKSPLALYRMYNALTKRIGYRKAPMNRLRLNGRYSDFVYQKSLNTIAERHHVRFWKQSPTEDVWLGAATEDVALRFRRMHWTHRIDTAIDQERAKVVNDLAFTGCLAAASLLHRNSSPERNRDRALLTDGDIAAIRFNRCEHPRKMAGIEAQTASQSVRFLPRLLMSFRDDLVRSNPFFTAFNTLRCLTGKRGLQAAVPDQTAISTRPGLDWVRGHQLSPVSRQGTATIREQ